MFRSLFARTFFLLIGLIFFTMGGWIQSFRVFNEGSVGNNVAQQIMQMANLTRYALVTSDPMFRPDLLIMLAQQEGVRVMAREPDDITTRVMASAGYSSDIVSDIEEKLRENLGPDTVLAGSVNGQKGLWVSISIDGDGYWLMTNTGILNQTYGKTWIGWAFAALLGSLLVAFFITHAVVSPLNRLRDASRMLGRGKIPENLPEDEGSDDVRAVNSSFNNMVQGLMRMENEREILLAGVSHDLRTPITRLRLETEMATLPEETREAMVSDLEQMETIVNQFLDYARKNTQPLVRINLLESLNQAISSQRLDIDPSIRLTLTVPEKPLSIMADPLEFSRVIQNLCTNAMRYGRGEDGMLDLSISLQRERQMAVLRVCDQGPGLEMNDTERLMRPFERGNAARSGKGTGLGLAIVNRIVRRCNGTVALLQNEPHGLAVEIRIPIASGKS